MFDPVGEKPDALLASSIVWFDAFVTNIDRTARNANLLMWHRKLWLIDHGAALFFHHGTREFEERAKDPFPQVKDHVLLPFAGRLQEVDAATPARLPGVVLEAVTRLVPESWSEDRVAYTDYLSARLASPRAFVEEAVRARTQHL